MSHLRRPLIVFLACLLTACASGPAPAPAGAQEPAGGPPPAPPLQDRIDAALAQANAEDPGTAVRVTDVDGIVLLTGQVLTQEAKSRASNAAAFSGGGQLRRLVNELRVVDAVDLSSRESDAALEASAARVLENADPALAGRLRMVVENATLYLIGSVTREEGDAAAGLLSRLDGVGTIRTLYDYVD